MRRLFANENTCTPTHLFIRNHFLNDQIWKFVVPLWSANEMSFQDKRQERRMSHKTPPISWSWHWTSICKTSAKNENNPQPHVPAFVLKKNWTRLWATSLHQWKNDEKGKRGYSTARFAIDKVQVILKAFEISNPTFLLVQKAGTHN